MDMQLNSMAFSYFQQQFAAIIYMIDTYTSSFQACQIQESIVYSIYNVA